MHSAGCTKSDERQRREADVVCLEISRAEFLDAMGGGAMCVDIDRTEVVMSTASTKMMT
jgi:hypothetical protein